MLIKTTSMLFNNQLVPCIQELHPYDLPEIIALPILAGEKKLSELVDRRSLRRVNHSENRRYHKQIKYDFSQ